MNSFLLALITAVIWGASSFIEKIGLIRADPWAGLWVRSFGVFIGGFFLTFFVPGLSGRLTAMGWKSFCLLALGGAMASVLAQAFFYRALKIGDIGRVAPVSGAWPLVGFFLSVLFLHEPVSLKKAIGVSLVMSGVALLR